ncbi:MAG: ParB/RepB/Spo0J family partition protein, partial [Patescibacteria group bacterium]
MLMNQPGEQSKLPDPIFHIETDKIKPNPYQPRKNFDEEALKELANSIREFGILHPLIVTKIETPTEFGTSVEYQLISGERRLMAAKLAGLERVPAII